MIRPSIDTDLPRAHDIYAHHVLTGLASFEEVPPTLAEFVARREAVLARGLPWLVAEQDGIVAGYAYASPYRPRTAYRFTLEDSIYMAPEATGRSFGRALLEALIAEATAQGYRQMIAVIGDSGNVASIGLHQAAGFAETGTFRAVGFKFGRWVDSALMQRALGAGAATLPPT